MGGLGFFLQRTTTPPSAEADSFSHSMDPRLPNSHHHPVNPPQLLKLDAEYTLVRVYNCAYPSTGFNPTKYQYLESYPGGRFDSIELPSYLVDHDVGDVEYYYAARSRADAFLEAYAGLLYDSDDLGAVANSLHPDAMREIRVADVKLIDPVDFLDLRSAETAAALGQCNCHMIMQTVHYGVSRAWGAWIRLVGSPGVECFKYTGRKCNEDCYVFFRPGGGRAGPQVRPVKDEDYALLGDPRGAGLLRLVGQMLGLPALGIDL